MEIVKKTFREYLNALEKNDQTVICQLDEIILNHFNKKDRKIWEGVFWGGTQQQIVGYGDLSMTRADKTVVDWFMVGIAVQKNYYSIYCMAKGKENYLVKEYAEKLGKVKVGSSNIQFKKIESLNLEALDEMMKVSFVQWNCREK